MEGNCRQAELAPTQVTQTPSLTKRAAESKTILQLTFDTCQKALQRKFLLPCHQPLQKHTHTNKETNRTTEHHVDCNNFSASSTACWRTIQPPLVEMNFEKHLACNGKKHKHLRQVCRSRKHTDQHALPKCNGSHHFLRVATGDQPTVTVRQKPCQPEKKHPG